jgi:hypothetical protein
MSTDELKTWGVRVARVYTNGRPVAWRGKLAVGGHGGAMAALGGRTVMHAGMTGAFYRRGVGGR